MKRIQDFILRIQISKDAKGQDLIEYALMAGFAAVARERLSVRLRRARPLRA